jgi:hypothetical protein
LERSKTSEAQSSLDIESLANAFIGKGRTNLLHDVYRAGTPGDMGISLEKGYKFLKYLNFI